MIKIWNLKIKQRSSLPIIIPIVIYHGKSNWNIGLNLKDILEEIPEKLEKYVPNFEYILYDLTKFKDEEIKGKVKLKLFIEILKYIFRDKELESKLKEIMELSNEVTEDYFETMIRYIINAQTEIDKKRLNEIILETVPKERGEKIMSIAEQLINEGIQKGLSQGLSQGLLNGLTEGIEGILDIKFGTSGEEVISKIKEIRDINKLEELKKQIKYAKSIDDLKPYLN